ncbi:unnamed protein product [Caenorhabditis angaria]|uniref:Poly(A) RNA polymerase mitochondrial-like central palm domain-containing protein n=1 Tax=Caenorhabditis angaria TaxID=860376 RepID=A0A9P1IW64_9PELO|nr:unnamed protein product [Caenorhabditis angaria]
MPRAFGFFNKFKDKCDKMELELNYDPTALTDFSKFSLYDPSILEMTVCRWSANVELRAADILNFLAGKGYRLANNETTNTTDEHVLMFKVVGRPEAIRIERECREAGGFMMGNVKLEVHPLIGTNGIRIQDTITMQRVRKDDRFRLSDTNALDLLLEVVRFTDPSKQEITRRSTIFICKVLESIFYKCEARIFGSFASDLRRQANSDVDISVLVKNEPENQNPQQDPYFRTIRSEQELWNSTTETIFLRPIHRNEFRAHSISFMINLIAKVLASVPMLKDHFTFRKIPEARTPIIMLKYAEDPHVDLNFDISFFNQQGVDKANLIELFMMRDASDCKFIRKCMLYFVQFGKSNRLLNGAYLDEKLTPKTGFNSYIFNHLVIHFVQNALDRKLVQQSADPAHRCAPYNFHDRFQSITHFFRDFFKHLATIDYGNMAIYNSFVLSKTTVAMCHSLKVTPMMILDPLDPTHNISSRVTPVALRHFNLLIRNGLLLMKQKDFQIQMLADTNKHAVEVIKKLRVEKINGNCLEIDLPHIIQTSADFCILLNQILRFDVSAEHEGTSEENLFNSTGVTFVIFGRAWIGRRTRRKQLMQNTENTSILAVELAVSRSFEFDYNEPVAVVRMTMAEVPQENGQKKSKIEVLQGNVNEIRDALHFLLDHFVLNNMTELSQLGIAHLTEMA